MAPYNHRPHRPALSAHRRRARLRHRRRPVAARPDPADAPRARQGTRDRPHHGDARLCRGAAARAHRSARRPGHVRRRDRGRNSSAAARACGDRSLDEPAAAARGGRPRGTHRARHRGALPRGRARALSHLPARRRQRGGTRGRSGMAAHAFAGDRRQAPRHQRRHASGARSVARQSRQARRRRVTEALTYPGFRAAAALFGLTVVGVADGPARRDARCAGLGMPAAQAAARLSHAGNPQSDDGIDDGGAAASRSPR